MATKLFIRRRDGRVEVRLNDAGRAFARDAFAQVVAAERDAHHEWHVLLSGPIDPSRDADDPVAVLQRQSDTTTNAELALASVDDEFINDAEAWAWLTTLQVALRSVAQARGVVSDERWAAAPSDVRDYLESLQQFLSALADVL